MKKKLMAALCIAAYLNLFSQENKKKEEADSVYKYIDLNEVIFSANKVEESAKDVPYKVEVIKSKQIEFLNPQTSADVMLNSGKVFVQKSQAGGGSPVLRGFEASRVLLVVDGVRMNNAIYRSGHLQNIITLDANMIERTEVLFGPSSVIYGSDALGGVMHFYTKKPKLQFIEVDKPKIAVNAMTRYSTVNTELTGHVDFNLGYKKVAFLTSVTYSSFGDMRSGNLRNPYDTAFGKKYYYAQRFGNTDSMVVNPDPNVQKFSGYSQYDVMEKILIQQNENVNHTLTFQYSNSSDVPRYDRLTEYSSGKLKFAEWYYGPQTRLFGSYKFNVKSDGKWFDDMNVIAAYQNIEESRVNRRFNNKNKTSQIENVAVYSLNADFKKVVAENHELRYGMESTYNNVTSKANVLDITTGIESPAATRYPDGGSTMNSIAGYISHSWDISEKLKLYDGLRYSSYGLKANFIDTSFFPFPYKTAKQNNGALTGNIGLVAMPGKGWRFTILGSSGYRAPNIDDLTKVFDSSPGMVIVPNPELKPEYVMNGEFTIEKVCDDKIKTELTGFYSFMNNAMVVKHFTLNGFDSVMYNGVMSKVMSVQNADDAFIYGISGGFYADFDEHFSFKATVTYTYGRYYNKTNDTLVPLDHIPPVYGITSLRYKLKKFEAEFYTLFNGNKRLKDYSSSGEDNLQYATTVGAPAWATLNIKTAYKVQKNTTLSVGIENIADLHYRYFASGISAPGRNFVVSLRGVF